MVVAVSFVRRGRCWKLRALFMAPERSPFHFRLGKWPAGGIVRAAKLIDHRSDSSWQVGWTKRAADELNQRHTMQGNVGNRL